MSGMLKVYEGYWIYYIFGITKEEKNTTRLKMVTV
jgi:hypothetical protein